MKKLFSILLFSILLSIDLYSQIQPPSPYLNYKLNKRKYVNFDENIKDPLTNLYTMKLSEFPINNFVDYSIDNSPIVIVLQAAITDPPCIYSEYIAGVLRASLSVGNNEFNLSQAGQDYTNTIYEHGRHNTGTDEFQFDIIVKLKVKAQSNDNDIATYEVELAINSLNNTVKQTKIIEENFIKSNQQIDRFYVSGINVVKQIKSTNLMPTNMFIELKADYDYFTDFFINNSVTPNPIGEELYEIPFLTINDNTVDCHQYDVQLNETDQLPLINQPLDNWYKGSIPTTNPDRLFVWKNNATLCPNIKPYLFQIQILRLFNTNNEMRSDKSIKATVDWSKALTLELNPEDCKFNGQQGYYQLKGFIPTEGTGYYIWRVRPIGSKYEGGLNNIKNLGRWSAYRQMVPTTVNGVEIQVPHSNTLYHYYSDGNVIEIKTNQLQDNGLRHNVIYLETDESLNWQHTRVYTEGNKNQSQFHDVMEYYNSNLLPVQTQRRLPSSKNVILQHRDYDMQNRLAIQSLPISVNRFGFTNGNLPNPLNNATTVANLNYKTNILYGISSPNSYNYLRYDGAYGTTPSLQNGLLNEYYNGDNILGADQGGLPLENLSNIPSAEGYPFTRTIYSNDGLNRLVEQSLPGKLHRIRDELNKSSILESDSKTVRNFVVGASSLELYSMFGKEAPNSSSVLKEISIDPNNVVSYTFKDFNGKVLATSLGWNDPHPNLIPLDKSDGTEIFDKEITNVFTEKTRVGDKIIINGDIFVTVPTSVSVREDVTIKPFTFFSTYCPSIPNSIDFINGFKRYPDVISNSKLFNPKSTATLPVPAVTHNHVIPTISPSTSQDNIYSSNPTTSSVNLSGEFNLRSEIYIDGLNVIKDQLLQNLEAHINGMQSNLKILDLIAEIDLVTNQIATATNQTEANSKFNLFKDRLYPIYGWEKEITPTLENSSTSTFTLKNNNYCIDIRVPNFDCDADDLEAMYKQLIDKYSGNYDFSADILTRVYNKYPNRKLYYTDLEGANLLNESSIKSMDKNIKAGDIQKSFVVESTYFTFDNKGKVIGIHDDFKKELTNLFYQYGFKLDFQDQPYCSTNVAPSFYNRINILFRNFLDLTSLNPYSYGTDYPLPHKVSRYLAVDDFLKKFVDIAIREATDIPDGSNAKNIDLEMKNLDKDVKDANGKLKLYIDNKINILDVLFKTTNRSLIGFSNCKTDYIEQAYAYIKNPAIVKYNINTEETTKFNDPTRDAWKSIENSDIFVDNCSNNSISNLKQKELAYLNIDSKIKGKIYQELLENQISNVQTNLDSKTKDEYYKKGTTLIDYTVDSWKEGDHKGSEYDILLEIIQSTKGLCENYKPVFEKALRAFFATSSYNTYIENEAYKYTPTELSTMRKVTLADLEKLINVLKIDCEMKTNILESQIVAITPPSPDGRAYKIELTPSQEKYIDALYNHKTVSIDKISFPNKYVRPSQEPPSGNPCRFTASLGDVQVSPELKEVYLKDIVHKLNDKLNSMKANLHVGTPFTEEQTGSLAFNKYIATPKFRAEKYREIINYLNNNILPQSNIFENLYYHNSDYISTNSCIGDFKNFEDLSLANLYCNEYKYPYNDEMNNRLFTDFLKEEYNYQINTMQFKFIENWYDFENMNYSWNKELEFSRRNEDDIKAVISEERYVHHNDINDISFLRPKSRMFFLTPDNNFLKKNVFLFEKKGDLIGRPENIQYFSLSNGITKREFTAGIKQFGNRSNFIINQGNNEIKSGYLIKFGISRLENLQLIIENNGNHYQDNDVIDHRDYYGQFSFESIFLVDKSSYNITEYKCDQFFDVVSPPDTDPINACRIVYSFDPINIASDKKNTLANKVTNLCYLSKLKEMKQAIISQVTDLKLNLEQEILSSVASYASNLDKNVSKTVSISFNQKMHHFTLYYYDKAGHLVRTVPPKGVYINPSTDINSTDINALNNILPPHKFVTHYKYNANGQVIKSDSPDETEFNLFKYSKKGFLKFSQSARQKTAGAISYIKYDDRMRISETGQLTAITPTDLFNDISETNPNPNFHSTKFIRHLVENKGFPEAANYNPVTLVSDNNLSISYPSGLSINNSPINYQADLKRTFIVINDYSLNQAIPNYTLPPVRTYLRNKLNHSVRDEDGNLYTRGDQVGTYYSYDAHGNVNFVIHDLPVNEDGSVRMFPKTEYEYDLVSKKVKKVKYNEGEADSYIQEYIYDEDNRLINVKTSRYGYEWENDANYKYAPHGTLARIEIGHDNQQGIDYSYTIQGWLKAINNVNSRNNTSNPNLNINTDPGLDGNITPAFQFKRFPFDAYSEVLNYFLYTDQDNETYNDFITTKASTPNPIHPQFARDFFTYNRLNTQTDFRPLFNGNIASWQSDYNFKTNLVPAIQDQTNMDYTFRYDMLNRLIKADAYSRDNNPNPTWSPKMPNYSNDYEYDRNGNITKLKRYNNSTSLIDNMTYNYPIGTNKLSSIADPVSSSMVDYDLDGQATDNYSYDASGNLTQDIAEGIGPNSINWTVDGKVSTIYKNKPGEPAKWIKYLYDASGNRVAKMIRNQIVNSNPPSYNPALTEYTLYARDANGQVMAIYERKPVTTEPLSVTACIEIEIEHSFFTHSCPYKYTFTLCDGQFEYTDDNLREFYSTGNIKIRTLVNLESPPLHAGSGIENDPCFQIPLRKLELPAGSIISIYYNYNYDKSGGIVRSKVSSVRLKDQSGNILSVEEVNAKIKNQMQIQNFGHLPKLAEWHIYGNSEQGRFAIKKPDNGTSIYYLGPLENDIVNKKFSRILGSKEYELKDHLGNVRTVISDFKQPATLTQARGVAPFIVDERSVNDYYPYGMLIPERSWSSTDYRYGYNGKENDNEVKGTGNSIDYGARMSDPRTGRFTSQDPARNSFAGQSPYANAGNNPIQNIDYNGLFAWIANNNYNKGWLIWDSKSKFQTHVTSFLTIVDQNEIKKYQNIINSYYNNWSNKNSKHYAPAVAEFFAQNSIPVGIGYFNDKSVGGETQRPALNSPYKAHIAINKEWEVPDGQKNWEHVAFHETVHAMGFNEFGAWTASYAAGYVDKNYIVNGLQLKAIPSLAQNDMGTNQKIYNELYDNLIRQAPASFIEEQIRNKIMDNDRNILNYDGYLKALKEYGQGVNNGTIKPEKPKN